MSEPTAETEVTFDRVRTFTQFGRTMISLPMKASTLRRHSVIIPLAEDEKRGVQRNQRMQKARKYYRSMMAGKPFLDSVNVNFHGDHCLDEDSGTLVFELSSDSGDPIVMEVLDGQHRLIALDIMAEREGEEMLDEFEFIVNGVIDADDALRTGVFIGQADRITMDRNHVAALKHRAGDYDNDVERYSYELLDLVNTSADSPIRERIVFGDSMGTDGRHVRHSGHYPVRSLFVHVRPLFGGNRKSNTCLLGEFTANERMGIVLRGMQALAEANNLFATPGRSGATVLSMTAFFAFFGSHRRTLQWMIMNSRSPQNPEVTFSKEAFLQVFAHTQRFPWVPRDRNARSPSHVAERLDNYIYERLTASS